MAKSGPETWIQPEPTDPVECIYCSTVERYCDGVGGIKNVVASTVAITHNLVKPWKIFEALTDESKDNGSQGVYLCPHCGHRQARCPRKDCHAWSSIRLLDLGDRIQCRGCRFEFWVVH